MFNFQKLFVQPSIGRALAPFHAPMVKQNQTQ